MRLEYFELYVMFGIFVYYVCEFCFGGFGDDVFEVDG